MSVSCGFYNSINHDRRYDATQMSQIFDGLIGDGVYQFFGDQFKVSPVSGMTISVGTGRAWFNNTWTYNDAPLSIIVNPSIMIDRIDTIVIDVDKKNRTNDIIVVAGDMVAYNPLPPELIHDDENEHYQYPLCDIHVRGGTTSILETDITNRVGVDCPFVRNIVEPTTNCTCLWKNASMYAEFVGQTLDLGTNISHREVYDALYVCCRLNKNVTCEITTLIVSPEGGTCSVPESTIFGNKVDEPKSRSFQWTSTGIKIDDCYSGVSTKSNIWLIPAAIYGIKWGKVEY